MKYTIYRGQQVVIAGIEPAGTVTERIMGEETASITFALTSKVEFHIGDKITFYGKDYFLSVEPVIVKNNSREFQYTLVFFSIKYVLSDIKLFFYDDADQLTLPDFSIMGTAEDCLTAVIANANRVSNGWKKGVVDDTEVKNVSFSDANCLEAISKIADEFKLEYWIDSDKSIHFTERKPVSGYSFEYGKAKGLKNITRSILEGGSLVTRLYVKGADKNLPKNYRGGQKNLRIDVPYLEENTEIYGIKEHTETFSDIYPKRVGTVTAVDAADPNRFTDAGLDFDLNAYNEYGTTVLLNGVAVKVIFQTGQLAGFRFELIEAGGFNSATKTFYLNPNKDEKDMQLPSALMRPAVGDTYILEDIMMPQAYVIQAESELKTKGQEYLSQNSKERFQYAVESDIIWFKHQNVNVQLGSTVHFKDLDFNLDDPIRVTGLQKDIQNPYSVKFDLSEVTAVSSIVTNYYEQQEQNTTIINSIKYNAELARRNYLFAREFHDNVFDGEGYFDMENIKPLSIETKMLSLGSRLQQFGLPGVNFQIQNNNALSNTAGKIAHQTINPTGIREWIIAANTVIGITPAFNYIYIKCQKAGNNANFVVTEAQIKVEADPDFYHFEVGYLSSVIDGYRKIKTTYGFAQLNPAELSIGRVADPTGNNYIDLLQDKIAIKAKVEFTSDSPAIEQIGNSITIGGRNLLTRSRGEFKPNLNVIDNYEYYNETVVYLEQGTQYILSGKTNGTFSNVHDGSVESDRCLIWLHNLDTSSHIVISDPNTGNKGTVFTWSYPSGDHRLRVNVYHPNYYNQVKAWNLKIERGNKATDWTPAPEDIEDQITDAEHSAVVANQLLADIANDDKLTPGEKQLLKKEYDLILSEKPQLQAQANTYGVSTTAYINAYNALVLYTNPLLLNLNTTVDIVGSVLRNTFNNYYAAKVNLLKAVTDQVRNNIDDVYDEMDRLGQELSAEIEDVNQSVNNLNNYVDGAFSDGIISAAEAVAIEKYINQLNTEQEDLQQKFDQIYNDTYLSGIPKAELSGALGTAIKGGSGYLGAHKHLINSIYQAIADSLTTPAEKADVDSKFVLYKNALMLLTTKFQAALSAIEQAKIDAIQIGGKNLLRNTNFKIGGGLNYWGLNQSPYFNIPPGGGMLYMECYAVNSGPYQIIQNIPSYTGSVTVSMELQFTSLDVNPGTDVLRFGLEGKAEKIIKHTTNGDWVKYTITGNVTAMTSFAFMVYTMQANEIIFSIRNIKVEYGNKATDWTPAPEDVQENINNAQSTANNAITLLTDIGSDNKLTASEKQTTQNEWNRIKSEYSNNLTVANGLLVSVTAYQSAYNALNIYLIPLLTDLTTTSEINGSIFRTMFKNYYDSNVAIITAIGNKQIENVQVGGRNFLKNSGNFRGSGWNGGFADNGGGYIIDSNKMYLGKPTLKTTLGGGVHHSDWLKLETGKEYTYSALIYGDSEIIGRGDAPLHYWAGYNNQSEGKIQIIRYDQNIEDNGWKLIYLTFKLIGNADSFKPFLYTGSPSNINVWIAYFKLERGNKATDWMPAIEDTAADITTANNNSANALAQAQNALNTAAAAAAVTSFMQTTVDGNVVSTGTLQVGDVNGANAMICGVTDQPNGESIRFAAGRNYANKYLSPFQVLDNGMLRFVNPISGKKAFELGFNQAVGKVVFNIYDDNGNKIIELGSQGIIFNNYISDSWNPVDYFLIPAAYTASNAAMSQYIHDNLKFTDYNDTPYGNYASITVNKTSNYWKYLAGRSYDSQNYVQYENFYYATDNNNNKPTPSVAKLADGWYTDIFQAKTEDTPGIIAQYNFSVNAFKVVNGQLNQVLSLTITGSHRMKP